MFLVGGARDAVIMQDPFCPTDGTHTQTHTRGTRVSGRTNNRAGGSRLYLLLPQFCKLTYAPPYSTWCPPGSAFPRKASWDWPACVAPWPHIPPTGAADSVPLRLVCYLRAPKLGSDACKVQPLSLIHGLAGEWVLYGMDVNDQTARRFGDMPPIIYDFPQVLPTLSEVVHPLNECAGKPSVLFVSSRVATAKT